MVAHCMFKALAVLKSRNLFALASYNNLIKTIANVHRHSITLAKVIARRSKFPKHKITGYIHEASHKNPKIKIN